MVEFTKNMRKNDFFTKNCIFIHFSSSFFYMGSDVLALWLQVVYIAFFIFFTPPHLALDDLRMTKKHGECTRMQKMQ